MHCFDVTRRGMERSLSLAPAFLSCKGWVSLGPLIRLYGTWLTATEALKKQHAKLFPSADHVTGRPYVLGYTSIALITVMSGERVNDPETHPNMSQVHMDPFFLLSFCPKFFWSLRFVMWFWWNLTWTAKHETFDCIGLWHVGHWSQPQVDQGKMVDRKKLGPG